MWHAVTIRRDKPGFMRAFERPISEHLSDELNKLEEQCNGKIDLTITVETTEYDIELVVKINQENK